MDVPIDRVYEALYAMRHDSGMSNEYSESAAEMADAVLDELSKEERRDLESRAFRAADAIRGRERAEELRRAKERN